jgi:hypothetical protein
VEGGNAIVVLGCGGAVGVGVCDVLDQKAVVSGQKAGNA